MTATDVDFDNLRSLRSQNLISEAFEFVDKAAWDSDEVAREFMKEWMQECFYQDEEECFDFMEIEAYEIYRCLAAAFNPEAFNFYGLSSQWVNSNPSRYQTTLKTTFPCRIIIDNNVVDFEMMALVTVLQNEQCTVSIEITSPANSFKDFSFSLLKTPWANAFQYRRYNLGWIHSSDSKPPIDQPFLSFITKTFTGNEMIWPH
jgi:hypothetical protein